MKVVSLSLLTSPKHGRMKSSHKIFQYNRINHQHSPHNNSNIIINQLPSASISRSSIAIATSTLRSTSTSAPISSPLSSLSSSSSLLSTDEEFFSSVRVHFLSLLSLAWPVVISYLLQYSLNIVNLMFIGHIAADFLAGAALGNMFVNITGYSLGIGFSSCVDTLASQSYGAKNYSLVGLVVQRTSMILILMSIPVMILWYHSTSLLIYLKQDPIIASYAGDYIWNLSPGLIPSLLFEVTKKYLIAQHIITPIIWVLLMANIFHVGLLHYFINMLHWGFIGAPIATATIQVLMLLLIWIIIWYNNYHLLTWTPLSYQIFNGWYAIIILGVPGLLMICLEWWSFELCALVAGWLGTIELDAFVVLLNIQAYIYTFPLGISVAVSTLTGNRLGSSQPSQAKNGAILSILLSLGIQILIVIIIIIVRDRVGSLFSSDPNVISMVQSVLPISCLMILFDSLQACSGGVLRGIGFQSIGAITNLIGYYLFGFPIAGILVQHGAGVSGLFIGLLAAVSSTAIIFLITISRVDWINQSNQAIERVKGENHKDQPSNPYNNINNINNDNANNTKNNNDSKYEDKEDDDKEETLSFSQIDKKRIPKSLNQLTNSHHYADIHSNNIDVDFRDDADSDDEGDIDVTMNVSRPSLIFPLRKIYQLKNSRGCYSHVPVDSEISTTGL